MKNLPSRLFRYLSASALASLAAACTSTRGDDGGGTTVATATASPADQRPAAASTAAVKVPGKLPRFTLGEVRTTDANGKERKAGAKSVPPRGYTRGMAESYLRMRARWMATKKDAYVTRLVARPVGERDALSYFKPVFEKHGLDVAEKEEDRLRALYFLMYELGVRETDGRYFLGIDLGPNKPAAEMARVNSTDPAVLAEVGRETEAGLFQSSWNFSSANPLAKELFQDFQSGRRSDGLLEVFKEGAGSPDPDRDRDCGTGTGAQFQKLAKSAPNFAVEYAALTVRQPGVRNYYFTRFNLMEFRPEVLAWLRSLE